MYKRKRSISGYFVVLARYCLASTLDYIVMQIRKTNREKGYYQEVVNCSLLCHELEIIIVKVKTARRRAI